MLPGFLKDTIQVGGNLDYKETLARRAYLRQGDVKRVARFKKLKGIENGGGGDARFGKIARANASSSLIQTSSASSRGWEERQAVTVGGLPCLGFVSFNCRAPRGPSSLRRVSNLGDCATLPGKA